MAKNPFRKTRILPSFSIPYLIPILLTANIVGTIGILSGYLPQDSGLLIGDRVFQGEWHRLIGFVLVPNVGPVTGILSVVFLVFRFVVFYFCANRLQMVWGKRLFSLFFIIAYISSVLVALIFPFVPLSNPFYKLNFLAFAVVFGNMRFLIYFIIPVKARYLLYFYIAYDLWQSVSNWVYLLTVLPIYVTLSLFFGRILPYAQKQTSRYQKKMQELYQVAQKRSTKLHPKQVCSACEIDLDESEEISFRYCEECEKPFCKEHLNNHSCTKTKV